MLGEFVCRVLVMILGYAYPAFQCFKTLEHSRVDNNELRFWCQYWVIVAILSVCERIGDVFISWLPLYDELKLLFIIYLWSPKFKGTSYVYETLLQPLVSRHETDIDQHLNDLRLRAWDLAIYYWQNCTELGQGAFVQVIQFLLTQTQRLKSGNIGVPQPQDHGPRGGSQPPPPPSPPQPMDYTPEAQPHHRRPIRDHVAHPSYGPNGNLPASPTGPFGQWPEPPNGNPTSSPRGPFGQWPRPMQPSAPPMPQPVRRR